MGLTNIISNLLEHFRYKRNVNSQKFVKLRVLTRLYEKHEAMFSKNSYDEG